MLSDWEEQQFARIEHELGSDKALARVLAAPTERERRWLVVRRHFYPAGYLACAFVYMVLAMGGAQLVTLLGALLVAFVVWIVIEVRAKVR